MRDEDMFPEGSSAQYSGGTAAKVDRPQLVQVKSELGTVMGMAESAAEKAQRLEEVLFGPPLKASGENEVKGPPHDETFVSTTFAQIERIDRALVQVGRALERMLKETGVPLPEVRGRSPIADL